MKITNISGEKCLYQARHSESLELFYVEEDGIDITDIDVKPNRKYSHYKHKEYTVLCLAKYEDEIYVVYRAEYICETYGDKPIWMRSLSMFKGKVTVEVPRFKLLPREVLFFDSDW